MHQTKRSEASGGFQQRPGAPPSEVPRPDGERESEEGRVRLQAEIRGLSDQVGAASPLSVKKAPGKLSLPLPCGLVA